MLVMGMGTLHIVVAYGQLWRSLGYRGGAKNIPKNLKRIMVRDGICEVSDTFC